MTMLNEKRLMCILAHPDDETLGLGSTLAKYAGLGVETHLLTATRGERGWHDVPPQNPGLQEMGRIRERELRDAAAILGLNDVRLLDYIDGDLDQVAAGEIVPRIVAHVRRVRPHVVITFAPDGAYGHPDHIAISQFTAAALVAAADPTYEDAEGGHDAHRVPKFYYLAETTEVATLYSDLVGGLAMEVDGELRQFDGWQPWAVTTHIDGDAYWPDVLRAIHCHETQLSTLGTIEEAMEKHHNLLVGMRHYYRAYSLVNGGRQIETDLFAGFDQDAGTSAA